LFVLNSEIHCHTKIRKPAEAVLWLKARVPWKSANRLKHFESWKQVSHENRQTGPGGSDGWRPGSHENRQTGLSILKAEGKCPMKIRKPAEAFWRLNASVTWKSANRPKHFEGWKQVSHENPQTGPSRSVAEGQGPMKISKPAQAVLVAEGKGPMKIGKPAQAVLMAARQGLMKIGKPA
jgi:hypothetical protein